MTDPDTRPVVIFCADTDTGYRLAQLLRREKRQVVAVMRQRADPSLVVKMGCEVVTGDPTSRDDVLSILRDFAALEPAVVCMLGGTPQLNSQGNLNVIDAVQTCGLRRLIMLTSIGCGDSLVAVDPFVKAFIGKAIKAKNWAETQLQSTDLDWTIIRPGGMVRRATRGEPILVTNPNVSGYINVFDLGDVIYQVLRSPATIRRIYTAVDSARAFDVKGDPLVPVQL